MNKRFICNNRDTVACTPMGKLKGFWFDGVYTFHGIRYAKAKRFQSPQPIKAWEGIKEATSYGFICPILEHPKPMGELETTHRFWPENENCQYLNIWTTSLSKTCNKPVLVWLHGGGFASGSSIEQVCYDGTNLAKYDDVVVVSVNHRLNVFGHLDLSDYGEAFKNSANAGIEDLVAALQWVKDNIAAFGGNPDNVTIFGQSGGGEKVITLGQSEAAKGLFHKAVIMSGVLTDFYMGDYLEGKELVQAILDELNLGEDQANDLVKIPTQTLIDAVNRVINNARKAGKDVDWKPKANHWFAGHPLEVGFTEYFKTIPTMVGTVYGEFSMTPPIECKNDLSAAERRAIVAGQFGEDNADELIEKFKELYPDKNEVYVNDYDTLFRPATVAFIKRMVKESSAPVYAYHFTTELNIDDGKMPGHCADLPFWFHNAKDMPICQLGEATERLETQMSGALTNFARTGNPNTAGLVWWKPSDIDHVYSMMFDTECRLYTDMDDVMLPLVQKAAPKFVFDPLAFIADDEDEEDGKAWVY